MTGVVKILDGSKEVASAVYSSPAQRNSIISYFSLLYDYTKKMQIAIIPDPCTEAEIITQLSAAGCSHSYLRNDRIHNNDSNAYRAVAV